MVTYLLVINTPIAIVIYGLVWSEFPGKSPLNARGRLTAPVVHKHERCHLKRVSMLGVSSNIFALKKTEPIHSLGLTDYSLSSVGVIFWEPKTVTLS